MLGSIQKYRPSKRPQPYDQEQMRALQGIKTSSHKRGHSLQASPFDKNKRFKSRQAVADILNKTQDDFMQSLDMSAFQDVSKTSKNVNMTREEMNIKSQGGVLPRNHATRRNSIGSHIIATQMPSARASVNLESKPMTNVSQVIRTSRQEVTYRHNVVNKSVTLADETLYTQNTFGGYDLHSSKQDAMNQSRISENGMSWFGQQLHDKFRNPRLQGKGRMNFGSTEQQVGKRMRSHQVGVGQDSPHQKSVTSPAGDKIANVSIVDQGKRLKLPYRIKQSLVHSKIEENKDRNGNLGIEESDSLLDDSYLPMLRKFQTMQRPVIKSSNEVASEYRKNQQAKSLMPLVPKMIEREQLNKVPQKSLFDRHKNILMHAQMQQPVKRQHLKSMQKTRFKDWVCQEIEGKTKDQKALAEASRLRELQKLNASQDNAKNKNQSDSSDNYDPLADSQGSSERSESPVKLTGPELQASIKQHMRDGNTKQVVSKGFWKGMVSCSDPDPPVDEEGNPIEPEKPELTSFQMIKRMLRLKAKQEAVPEHEKQLHFVPTSKAQFTANGKDKYYFDMQKNPEHYQMMTNDMTDEQFAIFEEREKMRADALHHSRKLIQKLVDKQKEEQRRLVAAAEQSDKKHVDIKEMGQFQTSKQKMEQFAEFNDDDELILMSILMDTSEHKELKEAIKMHVSKQTNKKSMFCPSKQLRMSQFARDIVNGIIWDDIKEEKVHPKVLFKINLQQQMGVKVNKKMLRDKINENLDIELGNKEEKLTSHQSAIKAKIQKEQEELQNKDLFSVSQKKYEFFDIAKLMMNSQVLPEGNTNALSYKRFYDKCQKTGTLALPMFSMAQNQCFSVVGQYISVDMANALAEVLARVHDESHFELDKKVHEKLPAITNSDGMAYIAVQEVNLDDNGLKDVAFASILGAIATQPSLRRINYVNNEIGSKSVEKLTQMLSKESSCQVQDLRITRVKSTKHDLNLLLSALSSGSNKLTRLRLAHVEIDEFVLMESMKQMVVSMPQIQDLNLSSISIHGRQLADLMEVINKNCQSIQYLNLSQNSLPQNKEWRSKFMDNLVSMITEGSQKLIDIDLSGMNFRENVMQIQWPLAKSPTLQAIHLSDNNLPKAVEINLLMVFGIKSHDDGDNTSITSKIDARQLKRSIMTGFQVKMQQQLEGVFGKPKASNDTKDLSQYLIHAGKKNMINSLEDATAKIANALEIRDMKKEKNFMQSYMAGGIGRGHSTVQPLVITRKLGHPELIFDENDTKNTHFKTHASAKWVRGQGNECWICNQYKYVIVFFSRSNWSQNYMEIDDPKKIRSMEEIYDLNQDDRLLMQNKNYPLILGSLTKNTAVSMTEIALFNLFLDETKIKKDLGTSGERAMNAVLQVSQGMKNVFGDQLSALSEQDWLTRFKDNLPQPQNDILICNMPETALTQKIETGEELNRLEVKQMKKESQDDVFVYAGFVQPGKHQIIIKDQLTNKYYAREIVVDPRSKEIINCHTVVEERNRETIRRFSTVEPESGVLVEQIDLDNSVYMNFKRYTKQDVENCFKADMYSSNFETIVFDEEELQECSKILQENYMYYCMCFHELAAQLDNFPLIDLAQIGKALYTIGIFAKTKADQIAEDVIKKYRKLQGDKLLPNQQMLLNRVKFAEVLLLVIKVSDTPMMDRSITPASRLRKQEQIEAIEEEKEEEKSELESEEEKDIPFAMGLRPMFTRHIRPFLLEKDAESMPISLNAFRDKFVWVENVSILLELNLEGIMEVFIKYQGDDGFVIDSANKVLKGIGCLLSQRTIKMLFDLSQMTVIDESVNAAEYDDMEFAEFLEFLVRIAYHQYLGDDRAIQDKVASLLTELLQMLNIPLVEPQKKIGLQSMASDEDIQVFHRYMTNDKKSY